MRARRRESGSTLLVVTVLLLVFLMAMALLTARVIGNARLIKDARTRNQSFYLADSGIRVLSERLRVRFEDQRLPQRLGAEGEFGGGAFNAAAVRLDRETHGRPGEAKPPIYVVTSRGTYRGGTILLAVRGELWYDGLRVQALEYGPPPEAWFDMEKDERRHPPEERGPGGGPERGGERGRREVPPGQNESGERPGFGAPNRDRPGFGN